MAKMFITYLIKKKKLHNIKDNASPMTPTTWPQS